MNDQRGWVTLGVVVLGLMAYGYVVESKESRPARSRSRRPAKNRRRR